MQLTFFMLVTKPEIPLTSIHLLPVQDESLHSDPSGSLLRALTSSMLHGNPSSRASRGDFHPSKSMPKCIGREAPI